jgi:hypothetical protein
MGQMEFNACCDQLGKHCQSGVYTADSTCHIQTVAESIHTKPLFAVVQGMLKLCEEFQLVLKAGNVPVQDYGFK